MAEIQALEQEAEPEVTIGSESQAINRLHLLD